MQAGRGAGGHLGLPGRRKDVFLFLVHGNLGGCKDPGALGL